MKKKTLFSYLWFIGLYLGSLILFAAFVYLLKALIPH